MKLVEYNLPILASSARLNNIEAKLTNLKIFSYVTKDSYTKRRLIIRFTNEATLDEIFAIGVLIGNILS